MKLATLAAIGVLGLGVGAQAATYNVTSKGSSATVNGALFQQINHGLDVDGTIDPFLQIKSKGNEAGYNTDGRGYNFNRFDMLSNSTTQSLLLDTLATVNIGGTDYRQFVLDLNEKDCGRYNQGAIQLTDLKIYLGSDPDTLIKNTGQLGALGTLVYSLDTTGRKGKDNTVKMKDWNTSGGDYLVSIPDYLFDAAFNGNNPYVYVYSAFCDTNGSYEQWSAISVAASITQPTPIPLPAAAWSGLSMLGVLGIGIARRKARELMAD